MSNKKVCWLLVFNDLSKRRKNQKRHKGEVKKKGVGAKIIGLEQNRKHASR